MDQATADRQENPPEEVLSKYRLGTIHRVERIPAGLIHRTYRLETSTGKYILQRLHPDLAGDGILADYRAVTEHLAECGFPSPRLVSAADSSPSVTAADGRYRMITYLEGVSHESVKDAEMAGRAARMLGEFHIALCEFRYRFVSGRPLHDSPKYDALLRAAVETHRGHPRLPECLDLIDLVKKNLPRHFLPEPLPSRVVHGDPKISNVLFDPRSGEACGLVDLDSCARHTVLVDLGDAVRSWCREGPEDQPSPFLPDRFVAVCEGYRSSDAALSVAERKLIAQSCRLITLELASRFLRDVFEDRYFGWDPDRFPSRQAHNLARARGCVTLYGSMAEQQDEMEKVVRRIWSY